MSRGDKRLRYEVVKAVDMSNVGLCVDTFQNIGGDYANPMEDGGIRTGFDEQHVGLQFAKSLRS